jgi:hypothetical protein
MQTDQKMSDRKIWFPAKKYGWGWGPPCAWQGWVVLVGWLVLIEIGSFVLLHQRLTGCFYIFLAVMIALLLGICWAKGEKPQWRWGNK